MKAASFGKVSFRGPFINFVQDHGGDDWYVADEQIRTVCQDDLHNGDNAVERRPT